MYIICYNIYHQILIRRSNRGRKSKWKPVQILRRYLMTLVVLVENPSKKTTKLLDVQVQQEIFNFIPCSKLGIDYLIKFKYVCAHRIYSASKSLTNSTKLYKDTTGLVLSAKRAPFVEMPKMKIKFYSAIGATADIIHFVLLYGKNHLLMR